MPLQLRRRRGKTRRTTDWGGKGKGERENGRKEELLFVLVEFLLGAVGSFVDEERVSSERERERERRRGN